MNTFTNQADEQNNIEQHQTNTHETGSTLEKTGEIFNKKVNSISYDDYQEGTKKVLLDSMKEEEKYRTEILGKEFVVYPNVFSPKYFFDTEFFAKEFPDVVNEDVLEIGPGTGATVIFAALKGAKSVTAIDINPDAVANTKENAELHEVSQKVHVHEGDLYTPLPEGQLFDTIYWNTPFGYLGDETEVSTLEKAVYDPEYKSTRAFIKDAEKYLKENGRILIGFSTTLGKFDILESLLKDAGYNIKLLAETESIETHPVKFEIFEARR